MLGPSDLEVNVLEFRGRAYQFDRIASVGGTPFAVFERTETESESKFRPGLVHLKLVVPLAWVQLDPAVDDLTIVPDGAGLRMARTDPVVEVGAEPPEFSESGVAWRRAEAGAGRLVFAPAPYVEQLLAPAGRAALGLG